LRARLRASLVVLLPAVSLLACTGSSTTMVGDGSTGGTPAVGDGGSQGGTGGTIGGGNGGTGGAPRMDAAQLTGGAGGGGTQPGMLPDSGPPDPMEVKFCNDAAKNACDKLAMCQPFILKIVYGDVAACQARYALDCVDAQPIPGNTTTPAAIAACLAAQAAQTCADYLNDAPVPACDLKGAAPNGDPCVDGRQCMSGNCSRGPLDSCGVCSAFVPEGGTCPSNLPACAPGLACVGRTGATTGVCTKAVGMAASCLRAPCLAGLYCNAANVCVPELTTAGAVCDPMDDACDVVGKELTCQASMLKCVPITYAPVGGVCNDVVACTGSAICQAASMAATEGKCVAPLASLAVCSGQQNQAVCWRPYRCLRTNPDPNVMTGNCLLVPEPVCE
jgi:hypothetical protein